MIDLPFEAFVRECRQVVDGRSDEAWPGNLVIADVGTRLNIGFLDNENPDNVWDLLDWAINAAWCLPLGVDELPALFLIAVPKHDVKPARFEIRHFNGRWERIAADAAPWFALSTAGSFRKFMLSGERAPLKHADDPRLFGTIHDAVPPTDENGII